jgi:hypothetical protein
MGASQAKLDAEKQKELDELSAFITTTTAYKANKSDMNALSAKISANTVNIAKVDDVTSALNALSVLVTTNTNNHQAVNIKLAAQANILGTYNQSILNNSNDIIKLQHKMVQSNRKSTVPTGSLDKYIGIWLITSPSNSSGELVALVKHLSGDYYFHPLDDSASDSASDSDYNIIVMYGSSYYMNTGYGQVIPITFASDKITADFTSYNSEMVSMSSNHTNFKNAEIITEATNHINTKASYLTAPQVQLLLNNLLYEMASSEFNEPEMDNYESLENYVGPLMIENEFTGGGIYQSAHDLNKFLVVDDSITNPPLEIVQEESYYRFDIPSKGPVLFSLNNGIIHFTLYNENTITGYINYEIAQTTEYINYINQYRAKWNF